MKTKELIRILQQQDPNSEIKVMTNSESNLDKNFTPNVIHTKHHGDYFISDIKFISNQNNVLYFSEINNTIDVLNLRK